MTSLFNLFKRYSVSILDSTQKPIKETNLKFIPRHGEFIYIEENKRYYEVINVIYYLNKKQGIFVIVEEFGDALPTKNKKS